MQNRASHDQRPAALPAIGATGSIGQPVMDEVPRRGYRVRALVGDAAHARRALPEGVEPVIGDITRPETLPPAVQGIDAVVLAVNAMGPAGGARSRGC